MPKDNATDDLLADIMRRKPKIRVDRKDKPDTWIPPKAPDPKKLSK